MQNKKSTTTNSVEQNAQSAFERNPEPTGSGVENAVSNAGIFLGLTFLLFFSLTGGALVAGVESGEIQEKVVEPVKIVAQSIEKSLVEDFGSSSGFSSNTSVNINTSSSTSVTIDGKTYTNTKQKTTTPQGSVEIKYTYPTYPPGKSYEDSKKEMD